MSVTRREALRVQAEGPTAAWWPHADQPAWARVTPTDLRLADLQGDDADELDQPALWTLEAYDDEREAATYELCLDGVDGSQEPTFVCRDAGTVVKFRDDVTFETGDDAQPLAAWFAWLQRRDALAAAEPNSAEWAGDDVDMQLARAGVGVVAMGEQTALLSVFDSVAEIRGWVDRLTPRPLVPLEVYAFDAQAWFAQHGGGEERAMHQFHETSDDDPSHAVVKWLPAPVDVRDSQAWFGFADDRSGAAYVSGYSEGGGQVSAFAVERAIAWGEVAPFLADEFEGADSAAGVETADGAGRGLLVKGDPRSAEGRWIAVRFAGMPSGIAVPCAESFVTWTTDRDGASFAFTAEFADPSLARKRAEQDFRLRWARWFNTDEALTQDELARGLAAIEATMKEFS